jgi:hypothetical protein
MLWFACVTVWTSQRTWGPATRPMVLSALHRIRDGANQDTWSTDVRATAVPGTVGCFLVTIPQRWEEAVHDPADGRVEVDVRGIPRIGSVKIVIDRGLQMTVGARGL